MAFDHIIGHQRIRSILQKSVQRKIVSHAYLFTGPEGIGKRAVALEFARLLNCDTFAGCSSCSSCLLLRREFMAHPDIKCVFDIRQPRWYRRESLLSYLNQTGAPPATGRKAAKQHPVTAEQLLAFYQILAEAGLLLPPIPATTGENCWDSCYRNPEAVFEHEYDVAPAIQRLQNRIEKIPLKHSGARDVAQSLFADIGPETYNRTIRIDLIRNAIQRVIVTKPYQSRYKIFLIDQADRMPEEAQNCLLKTLEEPPPHAIIILITSRPEALLSTIHSRCRTMAFGALKEEDITGFLTRNSSHAPAQAPIIAAMSGGSLSRALNENWDEYLDLRDRLMTGIKDLAADKPELVLRFADEFMGMDADSDEALRGIEILEIWCHDLAMLQTGHPEAVIFSDSLQRLANDYPAFTADRLTRLKKTLVRMRRMLQKNVQPQLALDAELFRFLLS